MAVKIRLSRIGKKHVPFYRVVAIDSRFKRDGKALEVLGTYDSTKGTMVQWYTDRYDYWVNQGAEVTDAVKRIQKKQQKAAA